MYTKHSKSSRKYKFALVQATPTVWCTNQDTIKIDAQNKQLKQHWCTDTEVHTGIHPDTQTHYHQRLIVGLGSFQQ